MRTTNTRAAALLAAMLLAGCASTAPQYYSLAETAPIAPTAPTARMPAAGSNALLFIELAPVAMPERFARPQLVVRQKAAIDGPQVDVLEEHRWSSSFENELRDALGSGIAGRLGAVDATRGGSPRGQPVVRIAVQLRQFDAVESSRIDAGFSWTLRRRDEGLPVACQLALSEPVDGAGIDALARGTQRATAKLADAIARSVTANACPG
ncbi:membrane integrity-associated transporter subunit PqiC [Variovorax sp. MHTC-1]|uniref:PqiC family protein n=1 Tax=Variovorax sp. MHTC-1 TaxID=2495593 RepID=UPI000F866842|nr:PqiC family protein [Variovorax sp. MHTC-1]RST56470.1 membrane integrity-associated transporter subunit PqiC [Variovorax sp. MHTC-1]